MNGWLILACWYGAGLLGSWLVIASAYREPWLDRADRPSLFSGFLMTMALFGPMNLLVGMAIAMIFQRPYKPNAESEAFRRKRYLQAHWSDTDQRRSPDL